MACAADRLPGLAGGIPVLPPAARSGTAGGAARSAAPAVRGTLGRSPEPTAGVVDSQSLRAAETVGRSRRGYDAGKKIDGTKRHIAVDTIGLLLTVLVTAADLHDRDGAGPLLQRLRTACPRIALVWADVGYTGRLVSWVAETFAGLRLQIVKRTDKHGSRCCRVAGWSSAP